MKNKLGWVVIFLNAAGIYLNFEINDFIHFPVTKAIGNIFNVFFDYPYLYYNEVLILINGVAIWSLFFINKKINKSNTSFNKTNFIFGVINSIFLLKIIFFWLLYFINPQLAIYLGIIFSIFIGGFDGF